LAFLLEIVLAFIFFRKFLSTKDIPGITGGIVFSILLLITGKFSKSLYLQKVRAFFFSFLLILIAVLAAVAHPDVIHYLGITLIVLVFFASVLLFPWSFNNAIVIGVFTVVNFIWIYSIAGTFVNQDIFGINIVLLCVAVFVGAIVKRSEEVLKKREFIFQKEIEEKSAIIAKELDLANKIHKSLIPESFKNNLVDIAVTYRPMLYMGGDYAKFHFIDRDKLLFVIADVTGHGVSSALLVNRVHTEIERLIREAKLPGVILKFLDEFINKDFGKLGFYLSAFCGLLDFSEKKLIYSNYGHPPQILLQSRSNNVVFMQSQTFLMGIGLDTGGVYNTDVNFENKDRLILFTDGIVEAKNIDNDFFGYKRLENFVKSNINLSVVEFNDRLIEMIDGFQNGLQHDDLFLLTIQTK
jgi:sigma-B regulation protein RsbU (phosphoserine phosphatase)